MDGLERVLERKFWELAGGVLGRPECSALDRSAEANVGVTTNGCSHTVSNLTQSAEIEVDEQGGCRATVDA